MEQSDTQTSTQSDTKPTQSGTTQTQTETAQNGQTSQTASESQTENKTENDSQPNSANQSKPNTENTSNTTNTATPLVPTQATPATLTTIPTPMMMGGMTGMMPTMNTMSGMMSQMPGFPPYSMFNPTQMLPFMNATLSTPTSTTKTGKRCGDWQAYITEKGKTYYFNLITKVTQWNKPSEFIDDTPTKDTNTDKSTDKTDKSDTNDTDIDMKSKNSNYLGTKATKELSVIKDTISLRSFGNKSKSKYNSKSERITAFRTLLSDKQIDCDWNWKKVLPKIVNDHRYNALTKLQDKKDQLIAWQNDEKKRIKDEERDKRNKLRKGYFELLDENTEKIIRKEYRKAKHYLESDTRYDSITSKHRREEWFEEWQTQAYKEYKKKRKKLRESAVREFTLALRESGLVTLESEYSAIKAQLTTLIREELMRELSERAQSKIYDEIYSEIRALDREKKREIARKAREGFKLFCEELIEQRLVHCKMRFSELESVATDARCQCMCETGQERRMEEIFDERMEGLKRELSESKRVWRAWVRERENNGQMCVISDGDSLKEVLPKLTAVLEGLKVEDSDKKSMEIEGGIESVSDAHIELLLVEYIARKQRHKSETNGKRKGGSGEGLESDGPQRKRQKTNAVSTDTNTNEDTALGMDEGEIEELEEGELSDTNEEKKSNGIEEDKGKRVKDRGKGKRDRKKRKKKSGMSVGVLYGMNTSDFDEEDLYYRGDVGVKGSELENDEPMYSEQRDRERDRKRRNHRDRHRWRGNNGNGRRDRGHYDLDYNYQNSSHLDNEINADSYNLDNHAVNRWNTGH